MRIGLLSNPHSGRNRRMLGHLQGIVTAAGGIHHEITPGVSDIPIALRRMAESGVDVVAVNGGDGSIALVLGCLLSGDSPFPSPPLLCALPGGTTNVTVGDVGIRGGLDTALLRLLAWRNGKLEGRELIRPVIGVRGARGQVLGCGLVFGAGAVVTGIEYWQESVRARGMRSEYSSGVAMIRTVWGMLRGHERFLALGHALAQRPDGGVAPLQLIHQSTDLAILLLDRKLNLERTIPQRLLQRLLDFRALLARRVGEHA
jgi:hypothetical protein